MSRVGSTQIPASWDFSARVAGESVVRDALDAIYEIDLSFYTGTKDASIANINTLKVRPDFTTPISGNPTFGKRVGEKG
jgi:hypothetical protein